MIVPPDRYGAPPDRLRDPAAVLVAHRGEPTSFPENSMAGFAAVLEAGARYLETDVQLSADGVPVLSHDPSLLRITAVDLHVPSSHYGAFRDLPAAHYSRFGERYATLRIARLAELVDLLQAWPQCTAFIEVKPPGRAVAVEWVADKVLATVRRAARQCVVISTERSLLERVRLGSDLAIGWILPQWSQETYDLSGRLRPDYLFVDRRRLPDLPAPLWAGPWRWVVYTVNQRAAIARYLARGFDLVETDSIRRFLPASAGPAA